MWPAYTPIRHMLFHADCTLPLYEIVAYSLRGRILSMKNVHRNIDEHSIQGGVRIFFKSSQQIHVHEDILKIDLQAANIESKFLSEHVLNTGSHD